MGMESRVCPRCKQDLPINHFGKNKRNKNGLQTYCKPCTSKNSSESHKRNKERYNTYQRKWRSENPEAHAMAAKYSKVKIKYGLSREEYDKLMEQTHCQICEADLQERKAHLDHCHTTGKIRGVLCGACNIGLGHFRDNPEFLRRAADYLG